MTDRRHGELHGRMASAPLPLVVIDDEPPESILEHEARVRAEYRYQVFDALVIVPSGPGVIDLDAIAE